MAKSHPVDLLAGDAVVDLPGLIARCPPDTALCVFHSMVLNQFAPEARNDLDAVFREAGRPLSRLWMEWIGGPQPLLSLIEYDGGNSSVHRSGRTITTTEIGSPGSERGVLTVVMDFALSPIAEEYRSRLLDFMDGHVYPAEPRYAAEMASASDPHQAPPVLDELKKQARSQGLWNLFLPDERWGAGLSVLDYAPLAEITGRSPHLAPEALNCSAPDTGNMEILAMFGTPEQQERWLDSAARWRDPLLFLDDRAGCRLVGRHQHPHLDHPAG